MSGLKSQFPDKEPVLPVNPCLVTREMPAIFLRFESNRERVALPYAALLKLELSADETDLDFTFATHEVRLRGRNLDRIYEAVSLARALQITIIRDSDALALSIRSHISVVTELRILPLTEADRRRR